MTMLFMMQSTNDPNVKRGETLQGGGELSYYVYQLEMANTRALRQIPQPVIAAVNGVAAVAGICFALAADVRVV